MHGQHAEHGDDGVAAARHRGLFLLKFLVLDLERGKRGMCLVSQHGIGTDSTPGTGGWGMLLFSSACGRSVFRDSA